MIGSFGVLTTGLAIKRIDDITSQVGNSLQGDLGANFSLIDNTPEGQLILRLAEQVADLWEFGEQVYNSYYPDTANGTSLDAARSMVNIPRIPETSSVVNGAVLTGTPGTVIPDSLQLSVNGNPSAIFQITASVTIGGGGTVSADFVCTQPGPIDAPAGQLTNIVTPVSGLASATNPTGAELGTFAETDAAYRLRSAQELQRVGTPTFSGLLLKVQEVTNVSSVYEFNNDGDTVDANGLLPHSVFLVVTGGTDADVAAAIFAAKGAGIDTNGSTSVNVVDSQGIAHAIKFSRLTQVPIYMTVALTVNNDPAVGPVYPANGDTLVNQAIVAFGASYRAGQTVVTTGFFTPINTVPGVLGATIHTGIAPSPVSSANIPIALDHIAEFLTANISVSH